MTRLRTLPVRFRLNGSDVDAELEDPYVTLLDFLRASGLTGSKEGCAEGECGACAVVVLAEGPRGSARYRAVNSCLLLLPMLHGRSVLTVEGVAQGDRLHPVQEALVQHGGSQCGYCTPGFVMSMFAEYYRPGRDGWDLEAIAGNLCRCMGYRPILDAARSLPAPAPDDPFLAPLSDPMPPLPPFPPTDCLEVVEAPGPARDRLPAAPPAQTPPAVSPPRFFRPTSLADLLAVLREQPEARLVAGGTDLAVEANLHGRRWPVLVSVEAVPELRTIREHDGTLEIGAALTLTELEERLGGRVPLLAQLFPLFASRLVRNRATLGGNLATASPIGDASAVLLALDAEVRVAAPDGERLIPLHSFFTGYRRTALRPGEVLVAVRIPSRPPGYARFYKVAKRQRDDISTVAAAFALDLDPAGRVERVRLAYGGVAPTPVRARAAEAELVGQPWSPEAVARACEALAGELHPIDDHRGSAAYRLAMVKSLLDRFYADWAEAARAAAS